MGIASSNLGFQNWYSDSLGAACGSTDNTLTLNNLPTPTEGFLVIDPNSTSDREVIHYTGKTSTTVTGVTRGLDGTTAAAHAQNTTVIMNITSSHFESLQDGSAASSVNSGVLSNPYKFSVYLNTANTPSGTAEIPFDTAEFDTGSNVDLTTHKGRFTAPVAGYYQFIAGANAGTANRLLMYLYKNGSQLVRGMDYYSASGSSTNMAYFVKLAASDYIEVYINTAGTALTTGIGETYFQGFLVSQT